MNAEQTREICRAYFYGYSVEKIAEIEDCTVNEVQEAINWGKENGYFDELKSRRLAYGERN